MILAWALLAGHITQPVPIQSQLDAWFAKDKKGQSCASCHSADGIELKRFSDRDIRRRIARHHQGEVAERLRFFVSGNLKGSGKIQLEDRPMQPGGKVLPGKRVEDRDSAFLENLKAHFPKLFVPVSNPAQALQFQSEILRLDLSKLPIGIEMNRLSEDGFHGVKHRSIANWFPDVPTFDSNGLRQELEAYLRNPSDSTLGNVDRKVLAIAKADDPFKELALAKYRSLMVFQHELRTKRTSTYYPPENPFWQVAEFGRTYLEADPILVRIPNDIALAKGMPGTYKNQLKELRLPWFWLGWIRDPSLTKTSRLRETVRAEYFCRFLEADGPYIAHESFMLARKLAEQTRNPLFPGIPFEIQYSFFLTNTPLIQREPKGSTAKALFRRLTANSFNMSMFLLESDLIKNKKAVRKVPQASQMEFIRQYMADIKEPVDNLVSRILPRLNAAAGQ